MSCIFKAHSLILVLIVIQIILIIAYFGEHFREAISGTQSFVKKLQHNLICFFLMPIETCRCNKHLTTNWRQLPPYVSEKNADLPLPDGILASVLSKMAVTCCQTCQSHGESFLEFSLDGDKRNAEKPSDAALKEAISEKTEFHFPIPGSMDQEKFGAEHGYWPLVQTPGVAYIVNTGDSYTPSDALNDTLLDCWAALLVVFVTSLLAGLIIWILVGCFYIF